jgi:HK97 family phage portal protein
LGLLDKFFKKVVVRPIFGMQSAQSAPFDREAYEHETVRAVVDCIASHAAKAEAMHVVLDKDGRVKEVKRNSAYAKLLNMKPNPLMTGYDLKYKLVTHLQVNTTALCYVKWGGASSILPEAMIPIAYQHFEILPISGGGYAVQFTAYDGHEYALNIEDVVVLRKFFNSRDVGGDGNGPLYNTLDMLKASEDGLKQAVTVSNKVRGLLSQKRAMLNPEDVQARTAEFAAQFSDAAKSGGIVGVDSMEEYTPLAVTPWSANAAQMKDIRDGVLRYWRVSNEVLMSDYTEGQWQAFFESVLEPILLQMGQAFTNVCFTPRERDSGNRIIFMLSAVMNASMQTRINLLNATKMTGELTINERRQLLGYPPVVGGDEAQISLNFIKASDQSKYQIGEEDNQDDGQDEIDEPAV